jgi:cytochrome c oxidase assembly protein subunit 11
MVGARQPRNARVATGLAVIAIAMVGASFAAVPLYRLFCEATGYSGTTQRARVVPDQSTPSAALITVRFNAETATELGWDFRPLQDQVTVHPGEERVVAYRAVNRTNEPVTGTATFNVTPFKAGIYFDKLQCFCFTKQHLAPGESADLSVSFFVDPDILTDPNTRDVDTITLSYTMFRAKDDGQPDGQPEQDSSRPLAQRRENAPSQPSSVN